MKPASPQKAFEQRNKRHMFKKNLKESNVWFQSQAFVIRHEFVQWIVDMDIDIDMDTNRGLVMPIKDQIKTFLQLLGMLKLIVAEQEQYLLDDGTNKAVITFL